MNENQEDDEFIAVRVQDPRVQGEGSWTSHVDYKIFLHTNSKSFTAKTSCVRRRYSEFVWLKKKLQKNSGLVPVPDLPGKSFFSFINEDFLEKRRLGLQSFLDKVLHMTVCLSDSQLHLFMQTQLPVRHIEDCVQGHTPYTVTDAILTYASSNRGYAQAQEEDLPKERGSSVVSYESMESPAPHLPSQPAGAPPDPLLAVLEVQRMVCHSGVASLVVHQEEQCLKPVVEQHKPPPAASFYLGSGRHEEEEEATRSPPAPGATPPPHHVRAAVEVHLPAGASVTPDQKVETDVVGDGVVMAMECLADMEPKEETARTVPGEDACTDEEEEEVVEQVAEEDLVEEEQVVLLEEVMGDGEEQVEECVNGQGDSGPHAEAGCPPTGLLPHVVSEPEEEEVEEEVGSEEQLNKLTSSPAELERDLDLDPERLLSCKEPGLPPGGDAGGADGHADHTSPKEELGGGAEPSCSANGSAGPEVLHTDGRVNLGSESDRHAEEEDGGEVSQDEDSGSCEDGSSVSSDSSDPQSNAEDQPEDCILHVNGHTDATAGQEAPHPGDPESPEAHVCAPHGNTAATKRVIWCGGEQACQETNGLQGPPRTPGELVLAAEGPELGQLCDEPSARCV